MAPLTRELRIFVGTFNLGNAPVRRCVSHTHALLHHAAGALPCAFPALHSRPRRNK
jgi:hypothetical protein